MQNKSAPSWRSLCLAFALLLLPLFYAQAHATPTLTKQTPHFVFHYPAKWSNIAEYLWSRAESDLQELQSTLGFRQTKQLQVRLAPAGKAFSNIQPGRWQPHPWVAGLAYMKKGLMTLKIRAVDGPKGIHQTFRHELSHLLVAQASQHKRLPLWFVEGLAMLQSNDYGELERYLLMTRAYLSDQLPPIHTLRYRFPNQGDRVQLAYATSFEFVLFLHQQNPTMWPALFQHIRQGVPFHKALTQQTGLSWSTILSRWEESLRVRFHWLALLSNPTLLWLLSALFFLFAYIRVRQRRTHQFERLDQFDAELMPQLPPQSQEFVPFIPSTPQRPDGRPIQLPNSNQYSS